MWRRLSIITKKATLRNAKPRRRSCSMKIYGIFVRNLAKKHGLEITKYRRASSKNDREESSVPKNRLYYTERNIQSSLNEYRVNSCSSGIPVGTTWQPSSAWYLHSRVQGYIFQKEYSPSLSFHWEVQPVSIERNSILCQWTQEGYRCRKNQVSFSLQTHFRTEISRNNPESNWQTGLHMI